MTEPIHIRTQAPPRQRRPGPGVVCAPDPIGGHAAPPTWLIDGLVAAGVTVLTLEAAADRPLGMLTLWDLVGAMEDGLVTAVQGPLIDPARLGVLGVGGGTPLAMIGGSQPQAARVVLLQPWSVEIAARRVDRSGANPREALIRTLTELQPLATLAAAPARPTLLIHAAAERNGTRDHAVSIAMGLSLDGRHVDQLVVACCNPEGLDTEERHPDGASPDAEPDEPARKAVVEVVATFLDRGRP